MNLNERAITSHLIDKVFSQPLDQYSLFEVFSFAEL